LASEAGKKRPEKERKATARQKSLLDETTEGKEKEQRKKLKRAGRLKVAAFLRNFYYYRLLGSPLARIGLLGLRGCTRSYVPLVALLLSRLSDY